MKPFLLELAEEIYREHKRALDTVTIVFPNRRAALYFRKHLASLLDRPAFAPRLTTIEEFIAGFSHWQVPDKLQLIHRLQNVYNSIVKRDSPGIKDEPFDQFYFWGEMLLRDFEEADKYLVNVDHLFKDLSHQKELDTSFDFLTNEQREFLRSFWINFDETDSLNKKKFLEIWRKLPEVYASFREILSKDELAYEGMLHREVAENISALWHQKAKVKSDAKIVFAGFNALTKAEEKILSYFVENQDSKVHWDTDDYYVNNERQEAARFFREYRQHAIIGRTFTHSAPANFKSLKAIDLYAAAQPIGQAKLMSQVLDQKLVQGFNPEETLIVLPDEKLLTPVLHGVSGYVDKLNVTMGFPLSSTPLFNLVELLIELQLSYKNEYYNHRSVIALLGHPYIVAADAAAAQAKRKQILQSNWVTIAENFLVTKVELHRKIFRRPKEKEHKNFGLAINAYLRDVIHEIGGLDSVSDFDKEYCFHFIRLMNKMDEVFGNESASFVAEVENIVEPEKKILQYQRENLKSFLRLFRQILRAEKIPFSGEPLRGLQIMGVLETRNLDFKNIFILSLNEGSFPSFASKGSYIPYNIRKAYGLPTVEQQDAIYAYLFYRMLQRAENVFLFYNSETDELGQGEMSRYLQQLLFESGLTVNKHVLHNDLQPFPIGAISVQKDQRVFNGLALYCKSDNTRPLSPSALNDYLECRLKFYFKYVARIKEAREIEEELDARVLGNFLHKVMELFYKQIGDQKGSNRIEPSDFEGYHNRIGKLIDVAFITNYGLNPQEKVVYEGQRLVVREIVKRFVDRIIELDRKYAPFSIEALERRDLTYTITLPDHGNPSIVLGGSIDRADKKGNVVRVIDYKTGKDDHSFAGVQSLFERESTKRNKAAFQTLLYSLLFRRNHEFENETSLTPGLMNRINLFNDDFTFGLLFNGEYLKDVNPLLPEFETMLTRLLDEIFNPEVPFDQTTNLDACKLCQFSQLCYR